MVGIYIITNNINGKVYIGQSKNIQQRWKAHRTRPFNSNAETYNTPLYRAIRKYGLNNFSFEILEECLVEELNKKEKYYIDKYNSNDLEHGYNLTNGGDTISENYKLSLEEVMQISFLLSNTELSGKEIGEQFNISQRMISGINLGQYYRRDSLSYPLRKIKEKESKNYCVDCFKEIRSGSIRCSECCAKAHRQVIRPSREQLKEEIRNFSFVFLGKKYNVSDNAIRRWCKVYKLPYKKSEIKQFSDDDWNKI